MFNLLTYLPCGLGLEDHWPWPVCISLIVTQITLVLLRSKAPPNGT